MLVSYISFSENQITNSNLISKIIPNFDDYEIFAKHNKPLKRYLDFNRYVFAKKYKLEKNKKRFIQLKSKIDAKSLSWKQNLLLNFPQFILVLILKIKSFFLKKGMKVTSYSRMK